MSSAVQGYEESTSRPKLRPKSGRLDVQTVRTQRLLVLSAVGLVYQADSLARSKAVNRLQGGRPMRPPSHPLDPTA